MLYFPSPLITRNWEKNLYFYARVNFQKSLGAILFYTILKAATMVDLLSVPFFPPPSYAPHDPVHFTTILDIIRQLIAQKRLLPLKHQKIQTPSLCMATSLSCFSTLNFTTDLSGQRPQGFAHDHPKNPISLLKGQSREPSVGTSAAQISLRFLPF